MAWSDRLEDRTALLSINCVATFLSLIGCLWTMFQFFKSTPPRSVASKLIFLLTTSDLIYSIANIMSMFENQDQSIVDGFCRVEAIFRFYSLKLSLFYSVCLAICCFKATNEQLDFDLKTFFYRCLLFSIMLCFFIGFLSKFVPAISYVNADYFCYFTSIPSSEKSTKVLIRTLFDVTPAFIMFAITVSMYLKAVKNVRIMEGQTLQKGMNLNKLFWYPAVQFFTFLPGFADSYFSLSSHIFAFHAAHLFFTHCIGFSNALVYGIQQKKQIERSSDTDLSGSFLDSSTVEIN